MRSLAFTGMKFISALKYFFGHNSQFRRTAAVIVLLVILAVYFGTRIEVFIPTDTKPGINTNFTPSIPPKDNIEFQQNTNPASYDVYAPGSWRNIGPMPTLEGYAGRIDFVKFDRRDSSIIYAGGANGGFWKSTDAGLTWNPKTDKLSTLACGSLDIDYKTGTLYMGTGDAIWTTLAYPGDGIYKSDDYGETWSKINSTGLPSITRFYKLLVDPLRNGYMYAATPQGFFRSTDHAESWIRLIPSSGNSLHCTDIAISPDGMNIFAVGPGNYCPVCLTQGIGYWKSSDGGVSFRQMTNSGFPHFTNLPAGRTCVSVCNSNPNVVYLLTMSDEYHDSVDSRPYYAYRSTNAGETFALINRGDPVIWAGGNAGYNMFIAASPFDPNLCFVGSQNLYRTVNGSDFTCLTGYCGFTTRADFHSLDFSSSNRDRIVVGCDGGVYSSTDKGSTYLNHNATLSVTQGYRISSSPSNTGFIGVGVQDMGILKKDAQGGWRVGGVGGDGGTVAFSNVFSNIIICNQNNADMIHYSTDEGQTWDACTGYNGSGDWLVPVVPHPTDGLTFYMMRRSPDRGDQFDLYRSQDGGKTWNEPNSNSYSSIRNSDITGTYATLLCVSKINPQIMLAGAGNREPVYAKANLLFRSLDGGQHWDQNWIVKGGVGQFPDEFFTQLKCDPAIANEFLLTIGGYSGKHVFRTVDAGDSWEDITGNLPNWPVNDIITHYITPYSKEYFAATDHGVFRTASDFILWQTVGDNLPNTAAVSLDYNRLDAKLRVSTFGRGVWEMDIPGDIYVRDKMYFGTYPGKTIFVNENLVICKGGSLIIATDCNINFAQGKKLQILDGGKLEIKNGVYPYFSSATNWNGLEIAGNSQFELKGCGFNNTRTPIILEPNKYSGASAFGHATIDNCDFSNGSIIINNRSNVSITNCRWNFNSSFNTQIAGILSVGADSLVISGNTINSVLTITKPTAISINGGRGIYIIGNVIKNVPAAISVSSGTPYISGNAVLGFLYGQASTGIGLLNCSDGVISDNYVSNYHRSVRLMNSSPCLLGNTLTDSTLTGTKKAAVYSDHYSYPRLAPENYNGMFYFDAGKNSITKSYAGDGIRCLADCWPDIDYGKNYVDGYRYYILINSPDGLQLNARGNCWGGTRPFSYKFSVTGGVVTDPIDCSTIFSGKLQSGYGSFPQGTLIVDRGLGIYDTLSSVNAPFVLGGERALLSFVRMQMLQSDFPDAILTLQQYLSMYKSGGGSAEAISRMIYCYDRLGKDRNAYDQLRNYFVQIRPLSQDSAFIHACFDASTKCLVKSGKVKEALGEHESSVLSASDSTALMSAEINVINDYMLINTGLDSTNFSGTLTYLKPGSFEDAARMIYQRAYEFKGDTAVGSNDVPRNFYLSQNYPNPFNPLTSIYYELPVRTNVKLVIYDLLGRSVGTFIDEVKDAGTYLFSFNGQNFASGIYFYRFTAGDFSDVKKMALVK